MRQRTVIEEENGDVPVLHVNSHTVNSLIQYWYGLPKNKILMNSRNGK